ncbi:HIT domain-containing protein [Pseudomonas sp. GD03817]|mgnify:FL=1|uniref:HIT family protein n=1 Tax=Pseudomonas TaxID=286 RepID=UPI000863585F|nr:MULTISPECIES: HIT domain-containing protein [Pseudomonas]MCE0988575.1 HIT domain-containing protein [Pseudomonas alloputida]MDD2036131.1 HIT domain-containing protein [Pseudomonas putida]MDD2041146.1 HIT domain-containing protein [Pseudomonas putida]MDF3929972.1 HIT domain-containing protein [Pseudomonas putida]MDH1405449.1 HIT domain-containing protein [Pseudomonas sp. GD03730]
MFVLDSRLQQDSLVLGEFSLCQLLLSKDANYPWFILVPKRAGVSELFELDAAEQQQLWQETTLLAEALKASYGADKMNVATLGNVVSQLHMHVIVRQRDDAAWPAPVWGKCAPVGYTDDQLQAVRLRLRGLQLAGYQEA